MKKNLVERVREHAAFPIRDVIGIERYPGTHTLWAKLSCGHKQAIAGGAKLLTLGCRYCARLNKPIPFSIARKRNRFPYALTDRSRHNRT